MKKNIIIVRGGGDIATGTIYKLHQSGYPVLVTEIANPSAIRRQTANPAHSAQRNPAAQKRRMISFSNRNHVIFTKKSVAFPLHLCYNL